MLKTDPVHTERMIKAISEIANQFNRLNDNIERGFKITELVRYVSGHSEWKTSGEINLKGKSE